jgi:hypothetical protein
VPKAAELPDIIVENPKNIKTKKKERRPNSAPENPVQFPPLPSEVLRRAVSARQPLETEPPLFFNPLHTETFDNQLLLRLQAVTESENKINPLHPLASVERVTFQDAPDLKGWRTFSRPQSAVESAITTPRPASSKPPKPQVASRYLHTPSRPISSRPMTARSRITRFAPSVDQQQQERKPSFYEPLITPQHLQSIADDDKMSPIEWFDDLTFESRNGDEWVQYGPLNGQPFTIAYSRFYTYPEASELLDWEWLPVNVLSYEEKKDSYLVEWHCNKQRKFVKRLNLLFEGENRDSFYKRIEKALKRRYFSESKSAILV